jgi:hypothetical protein
MTESEPSTAPGVVEWTHRRALAVASLLRTAARGRSARRLVSLLVGGLVVVAAARAGWLYYGAIRTHIEDRSTSYDFGTFVRAASELSSGTSPYYLQGDSTYAYPPLLAVLVLPFRWVDPGVASVIWLLASLGAIGAALWLFGVRDWRCYALAGDFPFVKSAVLAGTVSPLLLLCIAAAWRWRDTAAWSGAAIAASVALKLFLWPLLAWAALMRRLRVLIAAVGLALLFALVPWGATRFAGLVDYPELLRDLSRLLAAQSFSLFAIFTRLHLQQLPAAVLSVVAALTLIGLAHRIARSESRPARQRDVAVLTLSIAAALAASPIVWQHYFVLLLAPLTLRCPRLTPLWLVPFAFRWVEDTAWAYGDARKLTITLVLVTTMICIGVAGRPPAIGSRRPEEKTGAGIGGAETRQLR